MHIFQITPTFENCFLSLECEGKLVPASKFRQDMNVNVK